MRVEVMPFEIDGDTVTFRWQQDRPNPFQRRNAFFFRYEGVDLAQSASDILTDTFLALQLRVFAAYREPVEVHFPVPVSPGSAAYWLAFHRIDNVEITPLRDGDPPLASALARHGGESKRASVFFGGGKDSMLATCLLTELFGADDVVLIQFIGPLNLNPIHVAEVEQRQERLMLQPAREHLGVATRRVWSDYQGEFTEAGYRLRPNLELYTAGALPLLAALRIEVCAFSIGWLSYPVSVGPDGRRSYGYRTTRPEMLQIQSRHYRVGLGLEIDLTNVTMPLNLYGAFRLLAWRYPNALHRIVMCSHGAVDRRWCHDCRKCAVFMMLSLACGTTDPHFDYDRFLTRSRFVRNALAYLETTPRPREFGNAPWDRLLCDPRDVVVIQHLLARIDHSALPVVLSADAQANLVLLQVLWGNQEFPEHERIPGALVDAVARVVGARYGEILASHFEIMDGVPGPYRSGNATVDYDFVADQAVHLAELEHLHSEKAVDR